jgi:SAM-dependent methyltransferase
LHPKASSVSFDRAAERYDETRRLTAEASRAVAALLGAELNGREPCLEIGVGTGLIALPLHDAGLRLVGLDLSAAMLRKLVEKTGGRPAFPLLRGDATRLPFHDAVFAGAVARHVLHLIPRWPAALAELVRVVRPGGVLLLNIGGVGGPWLEVQDRLEVAAGPGSRRVGLEATGHELLDDTLERLGVRSRELPPVWEESDYTLEAYFQEAEERVFSWTWNVPPDQLSAAVETTRAWAFERFGRLDAVLEPRFPIVWRAYDLPA